MNKLAWHPDNRRFLIVEDWKSSDFECAANAMRVRASKPNATSTCCLPDLTHHLQAPNPVIKEGFLNENCNRNAYG
jgi:hypothetical protein